LDLGPVARQSADEDDGGFALGDAAEEQLPTVHLEEVGVGVRCRQGFRGHLVERDAFDAMWWLGSTSRYSAPSSPVSVRTMATAASDRDVLVGLLSSAPSLLSRSLPHAATVG
jgi:hypothetical protein